MSPADNEKPLLKHRGTRAKHTLDGRFSFEFTYCASAGCDYVAGEPASACCLKPGKRIGRTPAAQAGTRRSLDVLSALSAAPEVAPQLFGHAGRELLHHLQLQLWGSQPSLTQLDELEPAVEGVRRLPVTHARLVER